MVALLIGAMAPVALAARSHNVGTKSFMKAKHVGTTRITGRAATGRG